MSELYVDQDRYAQPGTHLLVEAIRESVLDLVRRKWDASGASWSEFVFGSSNDLITQADFAQIEQRVLQTGYRFTCSATISAQERPDAYQPIAGLGARADEFSFEHADAVVTEPDADGRAQRGFGENTVRHDHNTVGVARYLRTSEQVMTYLREGVPPDTIAIIDDSGGTLTAPVLEHFKGIVCAGGTVRSHLGILAREYGIACLMNARISGIRNGDRIELESSAQAMSSEDYFSGARRPARIWKLVP